MKRCDILISAPELAALMARESIFLADCRFSLQDANAGAHDYADAHIPGALYLHLNRDLSGPKQATGGRHPLPDAEQFQATMRSKGLSADQWVVLYDDSRGAFAARAWWMLHYFDHPKVLLLDGGLNGWHDAGLTMVDTVEQIGAQGDFVARTKTDAVVHFDAVRVALTEEVYTLVDARESARFSGQQEPIDPIAGHIPGAYNLPSSEATDMRGYWLSDEAQSARWSRLRPEDKPVILYCGSGVTACTNAVSRALGALPEAKLYPGSWSDWCGRPGVPVSIDVEPS